LLNVSFLLGNKDFIGIEQCLSAYLKYYGEKHASPAMYEQLGVAMAINKRDPDLIKKQFGIAADLARKSKEPIALIAACDILLANKYYEIELPAPAQKVRLSELLDMAMTAAPHRFQPILMSMLYAEQVKDPKRMAGSAEALLSLGWPGFDAAWRVEAPNRVAALAKILRSEGREAEAKELLDRLPNMEARDVVIRVTWTGDALLDLEVDEPLGATASHFLPRTVYGGALVKEAKAKDREAVYICPRGFPGEYTARINILYNNPERAALVAVFEVVTHEGTANEKVVIKKVSLTKLEPVKVTLDKGRRTKVLPYEAPKTIKMMTDEPDEARDPKKSQIKPPPKP
jgi:hypothetical protein